MESESQNSEEFIRLGKSDLLIQPLGVGTWAWGDRFYWGYERSGYGQQDVQAAFATSLQAGINFFDTAEIYGTGRSEKILGALLSEVDSARLVVATKFFPYPWRLFSANLNSALSRSLSRLELPSIHLYQIHWPYPPRSVDTWLKALAGVLENGRAQAVGVSNYNLKQTRKADQILRDRGFHLTSNQVEYSLLARGAELSGLLDFCRGQEISLIAYSPIGSGVLTGKYSRDHTPPGPRGRRYDSQSLEDLQPLLALMQEIGQGHAGKTMAQVALNWVICKGAIPIPGAKNASQAAENAGALGWRLDQDEVSALDNASLRLQR